MDVGGCIEMQTGFTLEDVQEMADVLVMLERKDTDNNRLYIFLDESDEHPRLERIANRIREAQNADE